MLNIIYIPAHERNLVLDVSKLQKHVLRLNNAIPVNTGIFVLPLRSSVFSCLKQPGRELAKSELHSNRMTLQQHAGNLSMYSDLCLSRRWIVQWFTGPRYREINGRSRDESQNLSKM